MEAKHIQDIMEAYASLYAQPEQEVLSEEIEHLDEITASMGRRAKKYKEDKEQAAHMERVRQHQHNMENNPEYRERHERLRQTHSRRNNGGEGGEDQKESFDLFDYLLEYLVAEGYADTNKAALAIMANMSEEWKQSIVEDIRGGSYTPNPVGDAIRTGAGLLQRAMSNPSVQGAIKTGSELLKKKVPPGGYSTRSGDNKPYEGAPLWDSDQKPEDVKDTPTPTRPRPPVRKPNPPMRDEPLW